MADGVEPPRRRRRPAKGAYAEEQALPETSAGEVDHEAGNAE
jgi:hypothetical protein